MSDKWAGWKRPCSGDQPFLSFYGSKDLCILSMGPDEDATKRARLLPRRGGLTVDIGSLAGPRLFKQVHAEHVKRDDDTAKDVANVLMGSKILSTLEAEVVMEVGKEGCSYT